MNFGPILASSVLAASLALGPRLAFAEVTSDQCIDANAKAQSLRRSGKLSESRAQLQLCVDAHCPGMVRDDCARRLDEEDKLQPTLVFDTKDSAGADLSAVKVTVDGQPLAESLDGSPLNVDPGTHTFTLEAANVPRVTRVLVIREGEKGRIERVAFAGGRPAAADSVDRRAKASADESTAHGGATRSIIAWTLGGVGIAGIGVGTVFGVLASSAWSQSKNECPSTSNCSPAQHLQAGTDHDTAVSDGTIADIGFIAGGVLVVTGAVLLLTAPSNNDAEHAGALRLRIAPSIGLGSTGIDIRGQF